MSDQQDGDSLGRRPAGARPPPKKRSLFLRRQTTKDSDSDILPPPALPAPMQSQLLAMPKFSAETQEQIINSDNTPLTPPMMTESPLLSPRLMMVSPPPNGRRSPGPFILSPKPVPVASPISMMQEPILAEHTSSPGKALRSLQLQTTRVKAGSPGPQSPGAMQWSNLRQALKTGGISRIASPAPSDRSFPAPRVKASIPKPSRFARLSARTIPQPVRGAEAQEARRFEQDVRDACWASKYARPGHARQKWSVDNVVQPTGMYFPTAGFSASALHLPFVSSSASVSNVSIPPAGIETPAGSSSGKRKATAQAQSPPASTASVVSLQPLFNVLMRYAAPAVQTPGLSWLARLPAESDVLAVMALPFFATAQNMALGEQRIAIDCFELIQRTWPTSDIEDTLDRFRWCCEVARKAQSPILDRLLSTIRTITTSSALQQYTPSAIKTCFHALFLVQLTISPTHDISRVIANVAEGKWIVPDRAAFEDDFDHARCLDSDADALLPYMAAEVLTMMLDTENTMLFRWCLSALQDYWPKSSGPLSDLQSRIYARISAAFCTSAASILRKAVSQGQNMTSIFMSICLSRVVPHLRQRRWDEVDVCKASAAFFLAVLLAGGQEDQQNAWNMIEEQWRSGETGREAIVTQIADVTMNAKHDEVAAMFTLFARSQRDLGEVMSRALPILFERLATSLPKSDPSLAAVLTQLGERYPQHFYKPLFACAGSLKDEVIAKQLVTLTAVARLTPNFWISNSEMISVAILGDVGSGLGKGKGKEGTGLKWGRTRTGQCVVLLELIYELRRICGDLSGIPGEQRITSSMARFATELENRVAILIDAKEQAVLLPFSQRMLIATLLLYLRKVTRSLKGATWLSRVSAWCCEAYSGAKATCASLTMGDLSPTSERSAPVPIEVTRENLDEPSATFERIRDIYKLSGSSAKAVKTNRPLSMRSPPASQADLLSVVTGVPSPELWENITSQKDKHLRSVSINPAVPLLSLLVAVNGLLQQEDYSLLGRLVWNRYLDRDDPSIILPASFLFMQYGERSPDEVTILIGADLNSNDEDLRQRALRRLSYLISRRNQTLSQFHITDRTHRRAFKGIRQPISFVATDVGSSHYVEAAEEEEGVDMTAGVARDVKKRLFEIGWVEDENAGNDETAAERLPLSLIPSLLLNRLGSSSGTQALSGVTQGSTSQANDPQRPLLRRKSSGSNYYVGVKRRIVFVSAVSATLQLLGLLSADPDPPVAGHAQEILSTGVRDDVSLIGRPIMETLSGDALGYDSAIRNLRYLLFAQSALPPSFAHHVFNHLVGFLKTISREMGRLDSFHLYAITMPLVARIGAYVPDLALRDLRRNKVESLLLPTGSLWFPANAPPGPMFPRSLSAFTDHPEGIPLDELKILSVRTAQNMLVLQLLAREPKDVYAFEKTALPVVPSTTMSSTSHKRTLSGSAHVPWSPWITLGLSYLLVSRQLFKSLSGNLNDRARLGNMLEGINTTLLAFPADLGIVTQSLLAYATAAMRFRRLLLSHNGFALFMPTIWKVYQSQNAHSSVRNAIHYTVMFFYTVYEDAFVFQSIDCLAAILSDDAIETGNSGALLYDLFKCLDRSNAKINDIAGLQDLFRTMAEHQASVTMDKAFSSKSLTKGRTAAPETTGSKLPLPLPLPAKRPTDEFPVENLIKLCLTIIAHDASTPRAPRFLRALRVMSKRLYEHSQSARDLLRDGIDALGVILSKNLTARLGMVEVSGVNPEVQRPILPTAAESSQLLAFRREYLHLVKDYTTAGGLPSTASIGKTLLLLRTILKDSSHTFAPEIADFLGDYAAACLKPGVLNTREMVSVLKDFSQLFQIYGDTVDCSQVLGVVEVLVSAGAGSSDPGLVDLVVSHWCRPALLICEAAASEHRLWDLPLRRATVSILAAVIVQGNMDVFNLLEMKHPTPSLLGGILLPVVVKMPTSRDQLEGARPSQADIRCSQWLRILSYILPICNLLKSTPSTNTRRRLRKASPSRGDDATPRQSRDNIRQRLATTVFAFQILKIVLLRATPDLVRAPSRIWTFVGSTLREALGSGNADFLFGEYKEHDGSPSPSPSRPVTPIALASSPSNTFLRASNVFDTAQSPVDDQIARRPTPARAVDFILWTMLELVASQPSPLMMNMRVFLQEMIQHTSRNLSIRDHRASRSPKRSSVFVRSRTSLSPEPSPLPRQSLLKWSPTGTPSPSKLMTDGFFSIEATTPSPFRENAPRIVHLGPVVSPAGQNQSTKLLGHHVLSATSLSQSTTRSIRAVRICMGYAPLDLLTDSAGQNELGDFTPWSRTAALARVIEETNTLIEIEFRDELLAFPAVRSASFGQGPQSPVKDEK